jgi:two-component system LytT family response regulator
MKALTALIIDDERRGRELLQQLLAIHCPEVTNVLLAATLDEALEQLKTFTPDLLFLDIRLGNDYGLDIISFLPKPTPQIIITTAYPEFAIKALRANVLDYLLKPIIGSELVAAVQKARSLQPNMETADVTQANGQRSTTPKKITVPTAEGLTFIHPKDVLYCKAEGAYTTVYLKQLESVLVSINLGELEKLLPESEGFFRVHHAWLINTNEIIKYVKTQGGYVVMSDENQIAVSQRKKGQFLEFIKHSN